MRTSSGPDSNTAHVDVNRDFSRLDAQRRLKSHNSLSGEKKEGGSVRACRDTTLHFFPPEMERVLKSCPQLNVRLLLSWQTNSKNTFTAIPDFNALAVFAVVVIFLHLRGLSHKRGHGKISIVVSPAKNTLNHLLCTFPCCSPAVHSE